MSEMIKRFLALGMFAGAALPAAAQDVMTRDPACKPHVTVRHQDCTVTNYYLCPGEDGEVYRAEMFHGGKALMTSLSDADYNTIGGGSAGGSIRLWPEVTGENKPLSLAQLKAEGRADYVETTGMDLNGMVVTMTSRIAAVILPGLVTIDAVEFRVAELRIESKTVPGEDVMSGESRLFLNDGLIYPIGGRIATTMNGMTLVTSSDPVEIILPGEPDFGTTEPRPGCGPAE